MSASLHIDFNIAESQGINEAMLLDRFFYHTAKNIINNRCIDGNDVWLYFEGGYKTLMEKFPRASKNKLHRWIKNLRLLSFWNPSK